MFLWFQWEKNLTQQAYNLESTLIERHNGDSRLINVYPALYAQWEASPSYTKQAHGVELTSYCRRYDAMTCIDVGMTSFRRHVPAGQFTWAFIKE